MKDIDPVQILLIVLVIFPAIGLHEYGHAKFADMAGDPTPRNQGRVTLNLFSHFDPLGFLMMMITAVTGYGIGWGRPVQVNPSLMKDPRWDHFISVAAGPLINLCQAAVYGLIYRLSVYGFPEPILIQWTLLGVIINLSLFAFNLIPLGILEGHWLLGLLLPPKQRQSWYAFNRSYGFAILIGLILWGQITDRPTIGLVIRPVLLVGLKLLTGRGFF